MAGMLWKGFPRNVTQAGKLLADHEQATGYKTLEIAVNTRLKPNFGEGGGVLIADGELVILIHYADGRVKVNTHGSKSHGRVARINAALPHGYSIRKRVNRIGYDLMHGADLAESFTSSLIFTPQAIAPTIVGSEGEAA